MRRSTLSDQSNPLATASRRRCIGITSAPCTTWPASGSLRFRDGVIVNSEPLHLQVFREVLARDIRSTVTEDEYYRELIGFDDKGAFKHIFKKHGRELNSKTFPRQS